MSFSKMTLRKMRNCEYSACCVALGTFAMRRPAPPNVPGDKRRAQARPLHRPVGQRLGYRNQIWIYGGAAMTTTFDP
jgi:hypothetical protein